MFFRTTEIQNLLSLDWSSNVGTALPMESCAHPKKKRMLGSIDEERIQMWLKLYHSHFSLQVLHLVRLRHLLLSSAAFEFVHQPTFGLLSHGSSTRGLFILLHFHTIFDGCTHTTHFQLVYWYTMKWRIFIVVRSRNCNISIFSTSPRPVLLWLLIFNIRIEHTFLHRLTFIFWSMITMKNIVFLNFIYLAMKPVERNICLLLHVRSRSVRLIQMDISTLNNQQEEPVQTQRSYVVTVQRLSPLRFLFY